MHCYRYSGKRVPLTPRFARTGLVFGPVHLSKVINPMNKDTMIEIATVEVRPSIRASIFSPSTSTPLPFVIQGPRRPHCSIFCGFEKKDDPYLGVVRTSASAIKTACTMATTLHQQAQQSGLAFLDIHNNSNEPHWNVNDWPPL